MLVESVRKHIVSNVPFHKMQIMNDAHLSTVRFCDYEIL